MPSPSLAHAHAARRDALLQQVASLLIWQVAWRLLAFQIAFALVGVVLGGRWPISTAIGMFGAVTLLVHLRASTRARRALQIAVADALDAGDHDAAAPLPPAPWSRPRRTVFTVIVLAGFLGCAILTFTAELSMAALALAAAAALTGALAWGAVTGRLGEPHPAHALLRPPTCSFCEHDAVYAHVEHLPGHAPYAWAACARCHDDVERGDCQTLLARSRESARRLAGAGDRELSQLDARHAEFWKLRDPSAPER